MLKLDGQEFTVSVTRVSFLVRSSDVESSYLFVLHVLAFPISARLLC